MRIKNQTLFFSGIIVLILGTTIIIFDYPQIQFLENMDSESYYLLDEEKKRIHQRMIIEFFAGMGIFVGGIILLALSFLKRFENGLR
ncbi:hypothetical protein NKOR_08075 [Candidatus Nitrosopumilus koreensis AR1]|uniref:Uncharacterized protein n=1 Tax=Candidatus Nitrosopumilus koreensis AR1 TaxID=1229908 RepID=K0BAL6_9ARCH|nr:MULTISPECIES: hypothetical protein [Nitrosopumilus]AFS81476.1 hypothetical protein NKOR_08075 [Candidatus Nitrosopumilus koreensis AR1]